MATVSKNPEDNLLREWLDTLSHKRIRSLRLLSQVTFFLLFNGVIFGLSRISFPAPVVMPPGAPFGTVWGGFSAIQYILSTGQFPFLVLGVFFITGAVFGKMACGWACPVGFWQDLTALLPLSRIKISRPMNRDLQEISGFILWVAVITTAILGYQRTRGELLDDNMFTLMPWDAFDPAGTLFVTMFYTFFWGILPGSDIFDAISFAGNAFLWKSLILFFFTWLSIKVPRAYCRWICPTGALLGYVSPYSIITVKRDPVKCVDGCSDCEKACPTGVPITEENPDGIANTLCINCGNCIDACPDAMSFGFRV